MNMALFAERIAGYTTVTAISFVLDYILWPALMLWQGPVEGGITMFWITLFNNLISIWAYDKIKKDLFAFEALHDLVQHEQKSFGTRLIVRLIKVGKVPAFIALSFYDPIFSVIYMRKGAGKYKMEKCDWWNFTIAMAIACIGWTLCWQGVFFTVRAVFKI